MSEIDDQFVKRGVWTDLDRGSIMGKTITTDTRTGSLIVALLAVLSTLGTAHLWHLVTFAIHQARANGCATDALFRQQQALLRTLPAPGSFMTDIMKLCWSWRHKANRPYIRSLVLLLIAIIFTTATVAASIFSSLVVDSSNITVLVDSPLCGGRNISGILGRSYDLSMQDIAPSYAKNCYKNGSLPASCNVFLQKKISLQTGMVSCPWKDEAMCITGEAFTVDSGLLDAGKHFGFNLAKTDGVKFRKKTTCSVLPNERYSKIINATDWLAEYPQTLTKRAPFPEEQFVVMFYGLPLTYNFTGPASLIYSLTLANTTGSVSLFSNNDIYYGFPDMLALDTSLIPQVNLTMDGIGDTSIQYFALNSAVFAEPIDDPLFSAHRKVPTYDAATLVNDFRYMADYPISALGCLQQYQFCYARQGKDDFCTELGPIPPWYLFEDSAYDDASDVQRTLLWEFIIASSSFNILRADSLNVTEKQASDANVETLPDDHWTYEVLHMEREVWASLQIAMADFAIGPKVRDPQADNYWKKPQTSGEKQLCQIQKMKKSGNFVNINVFGLSFVIAFSCFVALIDITLLKFLIYLSNFKRALAPRIDRWIQDGVWQLQRRAYEGEGHRSWVDIEMDIPLTTSNQLFKDLPIIWVPEKSPALHSSSTLGTSSISTQHARTLTQGSVVSQSDQASIQYPQQNEQRLSNMI